jgi:short subunit dehydrogenase-like uncharacterized protein
MKENTFLLYGANGYTGELIARYAVQYGLHPILAGRNEEALKTLAHKLNLPWKAVGLDDTVSLQAALREVKVVVHAAGPFQFTAKQMIEACLLTGTHYLDINGDISVFEMIRSYDAAAKRAGIMLMPGVGFDVVPTDCLALLLKKSLPGATTLKLAFASSGGGLSHGTATTMATKLGEGGAARKNGRIVRVPLGEKGMEVDFPTGPGSVKKLFVMSIPWGDVSTAYFTTGIPDIETYAGMSRKVYRMMKLQSLFNWLLRTSWVRSTIKKQINKRPAGPTDEERAKAKGFVWGRVTDDSGRSAAAGLICPEGYTLTLHSTLLIAKKALNGEFLPGVQTPAKVFGEDLVLEVPGVQRFLC